MGMVPHAMVERVDHASRCCIEGNSNAYSSVIPLSEKMKNIKWSRACGTGHMMSDISDVGCCSCVHIKQILLDAT